LKGEILEGESKRGEALQTERNIIEGEFKRGEAPLQRKYSPSP